MFKNDLCLYVTHTVQYCVASCLQVVIVTWHNNIWLAVCNKYKHTTQELAIASTNVYIAVHVCSLYCNNNNMIKAIASSFITLQG